MRKLAIIRSESGTKCPFGLSVGVGCRNAGLSVERMVPLESVPADDRQCQKEHNVAVYALHGEGQRCKYADKLSDDGKLVHCDFGEGGEGVASQAVPASPSFPKYLGSIGNQAGYFSFPMVAYVTWSQSGSE